MSNTRLDREIDQVVSGGDPALARPAARGGGSRRTIAKDIEAAVYAARLYIGRGFAMRIADEQRLYGRMNAKIAAVAKRRNMDPADAYRQIVGEAERLGGLLATPGKDI